MIMIWLYSLPVYATGSSSDNFTIPHSFTSGATISSIQMNENFQSIINVLNSMHLNFYANNQKIGRFLGYENSQILVQTNTN